jgi:hypothetical protein
MKLPIALVAAGLVSSLTAIAPTPAYAQRDLRASRGALVETLRSAPEHALPPAPPPTSGGPRLALGTSPDIGADAVDLTEDAAPPDEHSACRQARRPS